MKRVLSIFAFIMLLFTGACSTTSTIYVPRSNDLATPVPVSFTPKVFDSMSDHLNDAFAQIPGAKVPANAVMQVSWDLIPENDHRPARRQNCKVSIKDAFDPIGTQYKCRGVERSGRDFIVTFEVKPEKGPVVVKELNLSYMPGGFVEGKFYEVPFDDLSWVRYGSRSSKPLRVVWSSHRSVKDEE